MSLHDTSFFDDSDAVTTRSARISNEAGTLCSSGKPVDREEDADKGGWSVQLAGINNILESALSLYMRVLFPGFSSCPELHFGGIGNFSCQSREEILLSFSSSNDVYDDWASEDQNMSELDAEEESTRQEAMSEELSGEEEIKWQNNKLGDMIQSEESNDDKEVLNEVKNRRGPKRSTDDNVPGVGTRIDMLPRVMIVGRPNVGKSALFNRLTKRREALVYNTPQGHVTRDVREGVAKLGDLRFVVCDTAGLETQEDSDNNVLIRTAGLTAAALSQCHLALFLLDGRAGLQPWDKEVGNWLRKQNLSIPVVLIVNKSEGLQSDATGTILATIGEAHSLGFGEPIALSAETGEGLTDLYATLRPMLADAQELINTSRESAPEEIIDGPLPLQLAIAGRPNVGKSTILNSLLREERVLTGPEPGLTRDAVRVKFNYDNKTVYLVDTAGWMQRTHITEGPAALSAMHARRSVMRSNVVVLVLDGQEIAKAKKSMLQSEVALARWVTQEGRGLVVVVNKMDLLKGKDHAELRNKVMKAVPEEVNSILPQIEGIPIVFVSALEGKGRAAIMRKVFESYERWNVRLPTAKLNNWLQKVLSRHPRKAEGGYGAKMRYITQVKARPPTFIVFVTGAGDIEETDLRFVASALREDFDLGGIPIRVIPRHTRRGLRAVENNGGPRPRRILSTKSQGSQLPSLKRAVVD
ncbi:hypothetical protein KP509_31G036700 [Ceratopteris richardii]|nr:hypothetical protein KP509_31G036700 [Ceratopteris richardii]